jgi:drug/metabolite transporter (DMT)-like permease
VLIGILFALVASVCYGVASVMQSVAARAAADDRQGVDPRLLFRLLGQWRYLLSLTLDLLGLAGQVAALRQLPLFLVQAVMAASIVVTALLAVRWFGARFTRREWWSVALVAGGLALLGTSAGSEGAAGAGRGFEVALLVTVAALAVLGVAAGRLPDGPRTASLGLIAGLGFGAVGIAVRILPGLAIPVLVTSLATYTAVLAGVTAIWLYATALQRGGVVVATATMLVGETVPPSVVGVALLGDHTRPGWTPVAVAGFVIAVAGALVLARFGEPDLTAEAPGESEVDREEAVD